MKRATRWKSWAAIVYGFVAVTLGGFRNTAWSEDVAPPPLANVTAADVRGGGVAPPASGSLEQRVNQLDQQVQSLQQQLQTTQQQHTNRFVLPGQPTAQANEPAGEATAGRSGFALQSDDGNFLIRFQGLIQADGRFYTGAGANAQNYTAATAGSAGVSQFLLRRVRPILAGTIYRNFDFFFQPDFGGNTTAIYDAYLDIKPWSYFNVRGGKFKQPIGLERLQTDSYLTFAERGLPSDLLAQRDTGFELYGGALNNLLTYQASFTNGIADGGFTPDSDTNNAKDGALRVFAQPFKNTGVAPLQGLGLGLAGSYTADNTNIPTFKTAAGQTTFFSYNAATTFNGEHSHLAPQANYYWGPLGAYGEYVQSNQVAQLAKVKSRLTNDAWQAAASWVLTGEKASYIGVTPNKNLDPKAGTWGAWEITARVQQLQVDPDTFRLGFANAQTAASQATGYTVGVNWYLNKFVKLVADYEETWFNGGSGTGATVNDRPIERVFDTRWQVAF